MSHSYRSSRPDNWTRPRSFSDATTRRMAYGRVKPMEEPGFFERLFDAG